MNSGVTVESGDKFKQLIDKIKGLTEGEGNKGVQYAEGVIDIENIALGWDDWTTHELTYDIDFEPTILLICISKWGMSSSNKKDHILVICDKFSNSEDNATRFKVPNMTEESLYCYITNTTSTGCTLNCYLDNHSSCDNIGGFSYCAIGVGEEDTTLRDSLASTLENKGIDVTEEDDMASLINKIENIKINYMVPGLNNTLCGPVNLQNIRDDSGSGGTVYEKTFTIPEFPTNYKGMRISYNYSANWSANKTYPVIVTHERNGEVINTIESSDVKDITAGNVYGVWYSGDSKVNENWHLNVAPIGFFYNENRKQHPKHE
jgi:hypothetical protein